MLSAIGLLVVLAAPPKVAAVYTQNAEGRSVLRVTTHGKTSAIRESKQDTSPGPAARAARDGLVYHGMKFKAEAGRIVNVSRDRSMPLDPWLQSCEGGLSTPRGMVWLYMTGNGDEMGDPTVSAKVFVVDEQSGVPVQKQVIDVKDSAACRYSQIWAWRHGDHLMIRGNLGGLGALNLNDFSYRLVQKNNLRWELQSQGPDTVVSDKGDVYWQDGDLLKMLDWKTLDWVPISALKRRPSVTEYGDISGKTTKVERLDPYLWKYAIGGGRDAILVAEDAIANARNGRVYPFPAGRNSREIGFRLFVDRRLGVGVAWVAGGAGPTGSFLSLPDLKKVCPITGRR